MDTPLVSVILPTYNGTRYIREAIDSVLAQDFVDFELLIIDDASTDNAILKILQEYVLQDDRIRFFPNERNRERSWSKNFGVSQAKGKYIAFIDDDDIWEVSKLTKQVNLLSDDPDLGIVGTYAIYIDEKNSIIGTTKHLKTTSNEIYHSILVSNQFIHSSILMRKDIFLSVGGFPEFNLCEDYDLWLRCLQISKGKNIPEPLIKYRVRISSTTSKHLYVMKRRTLIIIWNYRKHFPHFYKSILFRCITYPLNIGLLLKMYKKLIIK